MDDYLNIYEYIGDEKQEYSTVTNVNKEEHEMLKIVPPQELQQQTQINCNQSSTATHGLQKQGNTKGALKKTKKCFILILVIILATCDSINQSCSNCALYP